MDYLEATVQPDLDFRFPSTQWELLARGKEAVAEVFVRYAPVLRLFLMRAYRVKPEDADDLVQGFTESRLLEQDLIAGADRKRGRFRSYLVTALRYYVANVWKKSAAEKRSPGPHKLNSLNGDESVADHLSADLFDREWARQTLLFALRKMEQYCTDHGREYVWTVFRGRLLRPIFEHSDPIGYDELAAELNVVDRDKVPNVLVTGKRLFERMLTTVVGEYCDTESQVQQEIDDLLRIFSKSRADSTDFWLNRM